MGAGAIVTIPGAALWLVLAFHPDRIEPIVVSARVLKVEACDELQAAPELAGWGRDLPAAVVVRLPEIERPKPGTLSDQCATSVLAAQVEGATVLLVVRHVNEAGELVCDVEQQRGRQGGWLDVDDWLRRWLDRLRGKRPRPRPPAIMEPFLAHRFGQADQARE
jgi:hypothetical protein